MSVAEAAHRPASTGRAVALWLAFLIVIAAGIGLAWFGAGSLRPEVTASGLQFRTVKAGSGEPIGQNDAALMDYILSVNNEVVQTSQEKGGPQPFAMGMVFPGFAEAMAKMQEGGVYRFTMPPRLAFGTGPAPQGFPRGDLTFEVQVRKVIRGGATMSFQGPPPNPPQ
jgi:hypothetical protein